MIGKKLLFLCFVTGIGFLAYLISNAFFLKEFCISIPVIYSQLSDRPLVKIETESKPYFFLIDTGCSWPFIFQERVLQELKSKELVGSVTTRDIQGNIYISPRYKIQAIDLGVLRFRNPLVIQEDELILNRSKSTRTEKEQWIDGTIGLNVLKNYHCLIDFPKAILLLANSKKELLQKMEYFLADFIPISFDQSNCGIVISIDTDLGLRKFLLDTGANVSVLNRNLVEPGKYFFTMERLFAGGHNFGSQDFGLYDFGDFLHKDIDGILGFDFFYKHPVYFDFQEKKVYILN